MNRLSGHAKIDAENLQRGAPQSGLAQLSTSILIGHEDSPHPALRVKEPASEVHCIEPFFIPPDRVRPDPQRPRGKLSHQSDGGFRPSAPIQVGGSPVPSEHFARRPCRISLGLPPPPPVVGLPDASGTGRRTHYKKQGSAGQHPFSPAPTPRMPGADLSSCHQDTPFTFSLIIPAVQLVDAKH